MNNQRTALLTSTYEPQLAIVVHATKLSPLMAREYYLESHSISPDGKILEGKPLMQETIQGIVDVFFDERKNSVAVRGLVPENLLWFEALPGGHYKMIWYRPQELRVMHFAKQLKLPTAKVWVPSTLYIVDGKNFSVYALKSDARPTERTRLMIAPYHNVADDGDVCLGTAKVTKPKEKTYNSLMKYWEDLFWLSEFTHVNGGAKVKSRDLDKVWKMLIESKTRKKWSDLDELIPCRNMSLKTLL